MLKNIPLPSVLCLDIETVPQYPTFEDAPLPLQELWNHKANNIHKNDSETGAMVYNRAGIYAEFGKIICISIGYLAYPNNIREFRLTSCYGDDEKLLLTEFITILQKFKFNLILCAHNGKEFDFPYISRRMVINGIELPAVLDNSGKKPWEILHLDTLDLWRFGDYKNYTPLNLLACVLNIPSPKDDIDGSLVHAVYWKDKDLKRIVAYCQKDVITVMQILLRFKGENILGDHEIKLL